MNEAAQSRKRNFGNTINPLPSLIRASAIDAADMQMRKACRQAWNEGDAAIAADTLDRLVRTCYGRLCDHNQPDMCFIRFTLAEQMERRGEFSLFSDIFTINAAIDRLLDAPVPARRSS